MEINNENKKYIDELFEVIAKPMNTYLKEHREADNQCVTETACIMLLSRIVEMNADNYSSTPDERIKYIEESKSLAMKAFDMLKTQSTFK